MTDEWERLELRCAISFQRLTDPAKGASCTHRSCCNFGDLTAYVSRQKECPIAGCSAPLTRSRGVERDDALRASLAAVPAAVDVVWRRGAVVRSTAPTAAPPKVAGGKRRREEALPARFR